MNRLEFRLWRRSRWLTQGQLAGLLGVNYVTLQRWESGASSVPPYMHLALERLDQLHTWTSEGIDCVPGLAS